MNSIIFRIVCFCRNAVWNMWSTVRVHPHKESDFLSFFAHEIELASIKASTKKNHLTTWSLLRAFQPSLTFTDLTFDFLTRFEYFMRNQRLHPNTIAKHMKQLKRYVNLAIHKGYMSWQQYPFQYYRIKTTAPHHTYLSPDELFRLESLRLADKNKKLQKTLDAFLFCCYTGMRYSDFTCLDRSHVMEGDWMEYRSVKTGVDVRLPLSLLFQGKAVGILQKYEDDLNAFFQLKNNSNINKELARIAVLAHIQKTVTFHTARHTNATLLIYKGVNITTVQKLLGHKSVKTTQLYSAISDQTIMDDLGKCFTGRNGDKQIHDW